jgi:hypothetical protein
VIILVLVGVAFQIVLRHLTITRMLMVHLVASCTIVIRGVVGVLLQLWMLFRSLTLILLVEIGSVLNDRWW